MKARKGIRRASAGLRAAGTAVFIAALTACGGGGGTGDPGPGTPPPAGAPLGAGLTSGGGAPAVPATPDPANPDPANPEPAPTEFRINLTTAGDQGNAAAAALPGGGFVAAWTSAPDGGNGDVRTKQFNAQGQPAGPEIIVTDQGRSPEVVALAGGGFLVTWSANPFAQQVVAHAQRFDQDGAPVGGHVQLGTAGGKFIPRPAPLPDGGFVLAADVSEGFTSPEFGRVARYSAEGVLLGTPTMLASDISPPQGAGDPNWVRGTVAAGWPDGTFAAAWIAGGIDASELRLTRFDAQGQALGTETVMRDTLLQQPALAALAGGETVLAWVAGAREEDKVLYLQVRRADGTTAVGLSIQVQAHSVIPQLTALAEGGFVLAWKSANYGADSVNSTATTLRFGPDGRIAGDPEQVGSVNAPAGAPVLEHDSIDVIGLSGGGFVVVHGQHTQETDWDVRGARR